MKIINSSLFLFSLLLSITTSLGAANNISCIENEVWGRIINAIKPENMRIASVSLCSGYVSIDFYSDTNEISEFMRTISKSNIGKPLFNTLDGNANTKSNMYIRLD